MIVEMVYEGDCPHVQIARANLLRAFSAAKLPAKWREWDALSPDTPAHALGFGSPTVLVNGRDVAGTLPQAAMSCCRLYASPQGTPAGAPSTELIRTALLTIEMPARRSWSLAVAPGIGVAMLPKLSCPLCWPAYAGLLSALGLSFLLSSRYLLILTALFLAVSVAALSYRAKDRRGYGPALVGFTGAVTVLASKFAFDSNAAMYGGLIVIVAGSVWNAWPTMARNCRRCTSSDTRNS